MTMQRTVELPAFQDTLEDRGIELPVSTFLQDPQNFWDNLPGDLRSGALADLGVDMDPDQVHLTVGRRPDGPSSVENILVRFTPDGDGEDGREPSPAASHDGPEGPEASPSQPTSPPPGGAEGGAGGSGEPASPPGVEAEGAAVASEDVADPTVAGAGEEEKEAEEDEDGDFLNRRPVGESILDRIHGDEPEEPETPEDGPSSEGEEGEERPFVTIDPPADPAIDEVERYPVNEPYAYVRILYDRDEHEYWYEVIEPNLSDREENVLGFIENTLVDIIEVGLSSMTEQEAEVMLKEQVDQIIYDYSITLSSRSKEKLLYFILRDFLGYAKLDVIMSDDAIEDVSCDGPNIPVFLYHRKYESLKSTVIWDGHDELDSFVIRLAQRSGKHISIADPLLDATLPDGSRLNATLGDEVTSKGSTFTIRKFKEDPFTPPDLIRYGTMNVEMLAYWWMAVQHGASAIYAGGTASGKTTSLNAILLFIPPQMKIVSIEDTREVNLPHLNWIPGKTRSGFGPRDASGHQTGEIDMFTLLKAALRQRPEYILVGEVRGEEAYALFQAMATGHTAYGTMHADSPSSVIHRLESDPISVPRSLLEALDIISIQIQTRIGEKRVRRTKQLVEVVGLDPHTREILTNDVFEWDPSTDEFEFSGVSYVLERIQMELNMSDDEMSEEMERRKAVIRWMLQAGLEDLYEVGRAITMYYKDPDTLMERVHEELDAEAHTVSAIAEHGEDDGWDPDAPWDDDDPWDEDEAEVPADATSAPEDVAEGAYALDPDVHVDEDALPGDPHAQGASPAVANAGGPDVDERGEPIEEDDDEGDGSGSDPASMSALDPDDRDGVDPTRLSDDLSTALRIQPDEAERLEDAGYRGLASLEAADVEDLAAVDGIGSELAERIKGALEDLDARDPGRPHDDGGP